MPATDQGGARVELYSAATAPQFIMRKGRIAMRNTFFALAAALTLSAASGCGMMHQWWGHGHDCDDCCDCDNGCCRSGSHGGDCGCNGDCDSGNCGCGDHCACGKNGCNSNCGGDRCGPGGCANGMCGAGGYGQGDCQQCGYDGCPFPGAGVCRAGACVAGCASGVCGVTPAVADQLGGPAGPPCAQVTYPYYTVRGPRDFLAAHPTPIGP